MNIAQARLINKLELWNTPGFLQFIEDLQEGLGPLVGVREQVEVQKHLYTKALQELQPKPKFKQTKLPI